MFEFDYSKLFLVGIVALIVVGPRDLPRVLRTLGQVIARMRRIRNEIHSQVMDVIKEADVDGVKKEFEAIGRATHMDIAVNPRTAIRGHAPVVAAPADRVGAASPDEATYSSPEMREYLAPLTTARTDSVEAAPATVEMKSVHSAGVYADKENHPAATSQSLLAPSCA